MARIFGIACFFVQPWHFFDQGIDQCMSVEYGSRLSKIGGKYFVGCILIGTVVHKFLLVTELFISIPTLDLAIRFPFPDTST